MKKKLFKSIVVFFILLIPLAASGKQIKGRYTTIVYSDIKLLKDFNTKIRMGRKLNYYFKQKKVLTFEDEVLAKVDTIIEKAEVVLDMFPNNLHVTIVLLPKARDVSRVFKQKYGKKANHIAYYSLSEDTIYMSVKDARLRVLAHEIGHAVVDHFFAVRPPYNIHELMAQFTEKHITD